MNGFNAWIAKRNFKKICIICIIAAVLCGLFCAGAVGYVYRDKVNLALQYEKASRAVKKEQDTAKLRQSMDALAASSNDICDVLLLDDQNRVLYTAKQSDFALNGAFKLQRAEGSRFLQSDQADGALFRFVKKDEFMLSAVFADDFQDIYDKYDEDTFYMDHLQNKKLYLISPLGKTDGNTKIYVISSPAPVPYGWYP